jgi:4-hydroxybenzoate polyprenyltransferase
MDGTLLRSDMLLESVLVFVRAHPLRCYRLLGWLARGKAVLKEKLAAAVKIDPGQLPYNTNVLNLLASERQKGRHIALATASHRRLAEQVAEHLGGFDEIFATENGHNLSATAKRNALVERYGERAFDYIGNARDDLPVWLAANRAYVVDASPRIERLARAQGNVEQVLRSPTPGLRVWLKALRAHQWLKNLLLFTPLLASHNLMNGMLWQATLAFVLFCLCASSVYLTNDLLDLPDDRRHATKRFRPLAAGTLPLWYGVAISPVLQCVAFGVALTCLPWKFAAVLAIYYPITLGYSFVFKRMMVIDVIVLAGLYTLRIFAGAMACELSVSFWMLAFSIFLFLSLAFVKRYVELSAMKRCGHTEKTHGRGYYPSDLKMISALGAASGYQAVTVLALYLHDPATLVLYRHPLWIWGACVLLLFWITRIWMLAHRGEMHDDPVVFAIRDRASLITGILFGAVLWIAT